MHQRQQPDAPAGAVPSRRRSEQVRPRLWDSGSYRTPIKTRARVSTWRRCHQRGARKPVVDIGRTRPRKALREEAGIASSRFIEHPVLAADVFGDEAWVSLELLGQPLLGQHRLTRLQCPVPPRYEFRYVYHVHRLSTLPRPSHDTTTCEATQEQFGPFRYCFLMSTRRATRPIAEELPALMENRGWRPLDVYAHGGPAPDATSRYMNRKRGLVAEPRVIRTLRKFERAFELPEGYFLEEQLYRLENEVRFLVREGLIHVEDLEALVEAARYEERSGRDD